MDDLKYKLSELELKIDILTELIEALEKPREAKEYIRLSEFKDLYNLGRTTVYRAIVKSGFPSPLKAGRKSLWRKSEVEKWLSERPRKPKIKNIEGS